VIRWLDAAPILFRIAGTSPHISVNLFEISRKTLFLQFTLAWRLREVYRNALPIINHVAGRVLAG
jgi:hypothetical protein